MRSQNDATHLLKRKRTKRQRSSSPQLVPMTSSSSNGDVDGVATERGVVAEDYNSMSSSSAPTTSSGGEIYESTEEEEDMANCLIMLAQGQGGNIGNSNSIRKSVTEKISSRKLSTIISSEASKAGFYVYECKTCNRTFPSFQALGGHRASHKKPKSGADESKSVTVLPAREDYVAESQFLFNNSNNNNNKGCKIHECSICGSEFTSGQALGGHMRRHRAAAGAAVANNPVVVGTAESHHSADDKEVKPRTILALDLNLPAPEDDPPPPPPLHHHHHRHDPGFQFGSTQQALVFSAPALVDCHY